MKLSDSLSQAACLLIDNSHSSSQHGIVCLLFANITIIRTVKSYEFQKDFSTRLHELILGSKPFSTLHDSTSSNALQNSISHNEVVNSYLTLYTLSCYMHSWLFRNKRCSIDSQLLNLESHSSLCDYSQVGGRLSRTKSNNKDSWLYFKLWRLSKCWSDKCRWCHNCKLPRDHGTSYDCSPISSWSRNSDYAFEHSDG